MLRAISEFDLIHLARTGQRDLALSLIAKAQAAGRNCFRVFTRCYNLFDLRGDQPGYWDAVTWLYTQLTDAGCYLNPVFIVDRVRKTESGEWVTMLDDGQTDVWVAAWRDWCRGKAGVLPALVNEPEQPWQGYSGPTDARLLRYASECTAAWGHKDFIIGAAADGDDPDASKETIRLSVEVAKYVNIIVLHSSRKGGANVTDGNLRRWINHLEGFVDVIAHCREVNPHAHGYHEEPMGHASVQHVPIAPGRTYEREYDAACALAGAATSEFCGLSYCYHYIRSQDAGTPGLKEVGEVLTRFPGGGQYYNDHWTGSPSDGFTWEGGKVRHYGYGGGKFGDLAYGTVKGVVHWRSGYVPGTPVIDLDNVTIWDGHWA